MEIPRLLYLLHALCRLGEKKVRTTWFLHSIRVQQLRLGGLPSLRREAHEPMRYLEHPILMESHAIHGL